MRVEPFLPEHIGRMSNFDGQDALVASMTPEELRLLTCKGGHYTLFDGDDVLACMGAVPVTRYRGIAWTLLSKGRPRTFRAVHATAWRLLREQPYKRIETFVDPTIPTGARWVRLLGFQLETAFRPFFFPDGRGAAEWVLYL